ncbi:disrupted in renal carcinoma protein 2 family protein [Acanthamoeba castellanii str. Neff]|uniref:Disrupted in renal carcinoma protein 2 family protein n=1 Tax=Acanthamoeba castellanii (strain ATCC 30010 / Neff) TaxID=1257118 RepID=L8GJL4_ACACF|nr:disrupted in renal carcinoma protein 2 family protein [Acanthamoeba castellanii str. Neff]ELR12928.1 disrupted in renal carcinoma protein 2 family protein [Acanthamoeba castellanii str. Neff]
MERRADKKNEDVGWTSDYTERALAGSHPYAPVGSGEGEEEVEYQVTAWRWWVLFVFSFASFLQSLVWFTFSSVPKVAKEYYPGVDEGTIDLLLNWGAIVFIPVLPYVSWLQTRRNGLLIAFWQGNALVFLATVIRTIPCWAPAHLRGNFYMQWTLHVGQILNAAAGPIVMALCSKLSAVWFPDNQRATATAIAYTANALGTSIGFLIGPGIAPTPDKLPTLLYVQIGMAALPIIGGIIYYRERPKHPPSAVALAHIEGRYESSFFKGMKDSLVNVSFMLVILAGGIQAGVTNGWQGVLPQALEDLHYTESQAGWLGFGGSIAGIVGGVVIGPIMDRYFQQKCKLLLLLLFGAGAIAFTWLTLSLPTPFFARPTNTGKCGLTIRTCQVVFVNERYKRWEAEMAIYHEKPQLSHPPPPLGLNVQE